MKDINSHIYHDHGMKKLSLPQPTSVYIIDPDNDYPPQVPACKPQKSLKSKKEEASMPSFKLLDEDSDEGERVVENNDDDCKIITEITVFDHIREKAKSLPFLAATPTTEYPPSLETLSLIRKRTHDRQLALNELLESSNNPREEESSEPPDGNNNTPSNMLTGDTIFEHIRKKAKCFPRLDEIKSLTTKPSNPNFDFDFDFDFDLSAGAKSNDQVQKETLIVLDSQPVKPKGKAATGEKSPSLANSWQSSSLATTAGETNPFLGFKSVFSFL